MLIRLQNLSFHARHGVLPQETRVGADFQVDALLMIDDRDAHTALFADQLEGTVNYAEAYEVISHEMQQPSALIEHVAARIARALLCRFAKLREVRITVRKCCPPITHFAGEGVSVEFTLRRKLIIWDFDGTLADTCQGIVRTMRLTLEQSGIQPLPTDADIINTIGLPLSQSIASLSGLSDEPLDKAVALYRKLFETEGVSFTSLFEGLMPVLAELNSRGYTQAIATSRGHHSTQSLCEQLGIAPYISHIVACEDVTHSKPHAEPVLKLCRLTHTLPADAIVIGDTTFDMEMGLNARVGHCLGVVWGNHTAEALEQTGAQVVNTPHELTEVID